MSASNSMEFDVAKPRKTASPPQGHGRRVKQKGAADARQPGAPCKQPVPCQTHLATIGNVLTLKLV